MDTLKAKKEERISKEDAYVVLADKAKQKALTPDELGQLKALETEIEALDSEIDILEKAEKRNAAIAAKAIARGASAIGAIQDDASEVKELAKMAAKFSVGRSFMNVYNRKNHDGVESEVMSIAVAEAAEAGVELKGTVHIPQKFIQVGKRKQLTVATEGTDVVSVDLQSNVIPYLQPMPVADQLGVTFLPGLRGDWKAPRASNDVAFAWETESSDANETIPTFNNISIQPKRVAGYLDVTMQMMKQSVFMLDSYLRTRLENRYALTIDDAIFNGAGTNEPTGIFNYSGVNVLTLGTTSGDMTYAALLSMIRDCRVADARNGKEGFVLDSDGAFSLSVTPRQSSGVEGNFIYPSMTGPLLGRNAIITNSLDVFSSTLHGIIYSSNWAGIQFGLWGGLDILYDPYTQKLGAKDRFVCNAFMNLEIEQAAEFSYCKDWTAETTPALT